MNAGESVASPTTTMRSFDCSVYDQADLWISIEQSLRLQVDKGSKWTEREIRQMAGSMNIFDMTLIEQMRS